MPHIHCPVCGRQFDSETATAMPFCSDRCRQVDLGRWLSEQYGLPIESEDGRGEAEAEEE